MRYIEADGERIDAEDRSEAVLQLRARGFTLAEVGEVYGITRERVRQIEANADPFGTKVAALAAARAEEFGEAVIETIRSTAEAEPSLNMSVLTSLIRSRIPRGIWLSENDVREVLGPEDMKRRHAAMWEDRPEKPRKYTDEDVLADLRKAFAETEKSHLSINFYRRYEVDHAVASSAHVIQRFGTWAQACKAAGVPHGDTNLTYTRRWTPDVCVAAVARFIREYDGSPSAGHYDEWSRGIEDVPSMATVRNRVGKWNEVLKLAFQKIEEEA